MQKSIEWHDRERAVRLNKRARASLVSLISLVSLVSFVSLVSLDSLVSLLLFDRRAALIEK